MIFQSPIKYTFAIFLNLILLQFIASIPTSTSNTSTTVLYTEKINSNASAIISNHSISEILEPPESISELDTTTVSSIVENGPHDLSLEDETATIAYKFRGPNPLSLLRSELDEVPLSEEDQKIRDTWGGTCTNEHWQKCSKIKIWGQPGGFWEPDKTRNGKLVWRNKGTHCNSPEESFYCLTNGWTTARCHMLCMAHNCNKDYLFKWDSVVKHVGQCISPILG